MSIRVQKNLYHLDVAMFGPDQEVTLLKITSVDNPANHLYYGLHGKWVSAKEYPSMIDASVALLGEKSFEIEWI